MLREAFGAHGGEEIDTQGDAFFVAFASASDAVAAAADIQRSLAEDGEIRVRIGIHSGEASAADGRYVGFSVHRAARIGAAAHGGQVLLSSASRELVEDDLPDGVSLLDLGLFQLKDIERPERLSQLVVEGLPASFPQLRAAEPLRASLLRRRSLLASGLAGVIAAAIAIPVFALGSSTGSAGAANVEADAVGFFSPGGRLLGQAPVGAEASAVAASEGDAWVASIGNDKVVRLDMTGSRIQTTDVGRSPTALTVANGFVWVANSLGGSVSKIDLSDGGGRVVDTIPVGNGPVGLVVTNHRLWVANSTDRTVMAFKLGARRPSKTIPMPDGADAIASGLGYVWVVGSAGNSVTQIDPNSETALAPISVGVDPRSVAVGAEAVWVANSLDGTVSRIDPANGRVKGITVGGSPVNVAASSEAVWVTDAHTGRIWRINPTTDKPSLAVSTKNPAAGIAATESALVVATSSAGPTHSGGTLRLVTPAFDSIDPAIAWSGISWPALSVTNDGLVTYQRVGGSDGLRLVPDLATSIQHPSPDHGRTYTFQVRSGVRYSNGHLVQPADFRHAIERSVALTHSPHGATGQFFLDVVGADRCTSTHCDLSRGVEIDSSSRAITFHLKRPDPDFLVKLALSSADAVPADAPLTADLALPATGPYKILRYRADRGLVLVRNPYFRVWNPAAQPPGYPDRLVWTFTDDAAAAVDAVRTGHGDYTNEAAAAAATLRRSGSVARLHVNPTFGTLYVIFNTRIPPFDNPKARQAVNVAIDRNKLAPDLPTCQVLPPNLPGYVRYCPYRLSGDIARARELVKASGQSGATVVVVAGERVKTKASYLRAVLAHIGFRARLVVSDDRWNDALSTGQGLQVSMTGWGFDYPSAFNAFWPLLVCPTFRPQSTEYNNSGGFCDPSIDEEVRQAASAQIDDPQRAGRLWSKADHDVVDEAAWAPFANATLTEFVSRRVGNYQYNPWWGALLDQMWVR